MGRPIGRGHSAATVLYVSFFTRGYDSVVVRLEGRACFRAGRSANSLAEKEGMMGWFLWSSIFSLETGRACLAWPKPQSSSC